MNHYTTVGTSRRPASPRHWLFAAVLLAFAGGLAPMDLTAQQRDRHPTPAERGMMESQLRERLAARVKHELQLTDAQSAKLMVTNARIDQQRRPLLQRERTLRAQLRAELERGAAAQDRTVGPLLEGLLAVHRKRLELVETEQRELGQFMTPVQRARYFSLQENWRRQVEHQAEQDRGRTPSRRPGSRTGPDSGGRGARRPQR